MMTIKLFAKNKNQIWVTKYVNTLQRMTQINQSFMNKHMENQACL